VWGDSAGELLENVVGDETNEVNSLPSHMWDLMFPLDAQWPTTSPDTADSAAQEPTQESAPADEPSAEEPSAEEPLAQTEPSLSPPPPVPPVNSGLPEGLN